MIHYMYYIVGVRFEKNSVSRVEIVVDEFSIFVAVYCVNKWWRGDKLVSQSLGNYANDWH